MGIYVGMQALFNSFKESLNSKEPSFVDSQLSRFERGTLVLSLKSDWNITHEDGSFVYG